MPGLALLDPTRSGREVEDLEDKLHHLVAGQDEAIHQIVWTYQNLFGGPAPSRPTGWQLSVPGSDRVREDAPRRGDG